MYGEADPDPNAAYTVYINRYRRVKLMNDTKLRFEITTNNGKTWAQAEQTEELTDKWIDALTRQRLAIAEILENM